MLIFLDVVLVKIDILLIDESDFRVLLRKLYVWRDFKLVLFDILEV